MNNEQARGIFIKAVSVVAVVIAAIGLLVAVLFQYRILDF